jgi:hypothetical protein
MVAAEADHDTHPTAIKLVNNAPFVIFICNLVFEVFICLCQNPSGETIGQAKEWLQENKLIGCQETAAP